MGGAASIGIIPLYIRFFGIEAYGLIGIFVALYAIVSLLDLGLGTALNRELARLSMQQQAGQQMHGLVRTLESCTPIVDWAQ